MTRFREHFIARRGLSPHDLINANIAFLEAELDLAESKAERLSVLERSLEQYRKFEEISRQMAETGTGRRVDYLAAEAARLKAEIALHRKRKSE